MANDYLIRAERDGKWLEAIAAYSELARTHTSAGFHGMASEFHYRQEIVQRKLQGQQLKADFEGIDSFKNFSNFRTIFQVASVWLFTYVVEISTGYFERPVRVILSALFTMLLFSTLYFDFEGWQISVSGFERFLEQWVRSIYFSAVSFTALGYGGWVVQPEGWNRYLGVIESVIGVSFISMIVLTISRRFVR